MKIAILASEVVPFVKTGGLADVAGALPLALEKEAQEVIIIMPYYKAAKKNSGIIRVKEDIHCCVIGKNIKVYFVGNDKYFNREGLYGDKKGDYKDNLERFSFYCIRALVLMKELKFSPDIIHCHDWQTALIPVYLKTVYSKDSFYKNTKSLLTIHNIGYQGLFSKEEFSMTGLDAGLFNMEQLEFFGRLNLLKGGIVFSDLISTVSPTYAREIQTEEFGFGLEGVLKSRRDSVFGILNGIDYSIWNPQADRFIASNYSVSGLKGKAEDKLELQKICGLAEKADVLLLGMVSRLIEAKGFDILSQSMNEICRMNVQLVILATGDVKYHKIFENLAGKYPKNISLHLKFDDVLAHKIYAGSDAFLMPSKYEPCGLGQLISLRYGTIPLVFKTGGLADTVTFERGFLLERYKKEDLIKTISEAVGVFANKDKWAKLVKNAFGCNFSWEESAKKYVQLYERAKNQA